MKRASLRLFGAALWFSVWTAACTTTTPPPPAPLPSAETAPVPVPPVRVAPPAVPAPSGSVFRVGLKSDLTEVTLGTAGTMWIVASGDRAELVQGPLTVQPGGGGGGEAAPSFQIQAGAFSQEEPARKLADRLGAANQLSAQVAFSADRGLYRVLLGGFASRADADAAVERLKASGQDGFVVPGAPRAASGQAGQAASRVTVTGGANVRMELASPVDFYPPAPDARVAWDGVAYRGSLRVLVNPRGTLNVVNRADLEDYLYGVVPSEMGPRRFDAIEALKAQAVAARTYALAHRGQFEAEGYDICATPKCQVYGGVPVEDPLSSAAVDGTRGLVLAYQGQIADALFVSTCGGVTENVENVFSGGPVPYLVAVECGELAGADVEGARMPRDGSGAGARSALQWRGYVLRRNVPRRAAIRGAALETAQRWAGVEAKGAAPAKLSPAAVYPSLVADFGLAPSQELHLTDRDQRYYDESPAVAGRLTGSARSAYEFLWRFRFAAAETLPPPDRDLTEEEYAGLLFSIALRLSGVTEGSGRFLSREGSNLWVKTTEGRQGLPVDPEVPLARRVADRYLPAGSLTLRAGDRLRWWKDGAGRVLGLWVETDADGPSFERDSAWTEWVRRVPAKELARRMSGRVAGNEVRELTVTKRSPSGRAIEMHVQTDLAEATFKRFDLRQAVEMPEMLFTVTKVAGPQGEAEFVFLGRGWGHGVGLCQNGAFGMALAGETYDRILRHYYTGIDIVAASTVTAAPPSTR
ncbi:MAG TPA: SpoIID/LytB domain-containing protein [Thermoanaerobaculia bacterium]